MTSYAIEAKNRRLVNQPKWLAEGLHYEVIMGSNAYGVASDSSDLDLYGFATPPVEMTFPHLAGEISGFGQQIQRFEQWQEHHVEGWKQVDGKSQTLDFSIYSIVKYFQLVMENNPNMVDANFCPDRCVTHITPLGQHVRDNRKLFLHKGSKFKFLGYAYSQLKKIRTKTNYSNPKRASDVEKHGYSTKFAYHLVRLVNEGRQILEEGDLDLERSREQLKSVRRGDWSLEHLEKWFEAQELQMEEVYSNSKLRNKPDEKAIRTLLVECLEMQYGSIDSLLKIDKQGTLFTELSHLVEKYSQGRSRSQVL